MKSFLSAITITSLFASSFAAPTATNQKRACADAVNDALEPQASSIVASLGSTLSTYTDAIATAHTAFVSSGDIVAATSSYSDAVSSITSAFTDANTQVTALTGVSNADVDSQYGDCIITSLKKRQTATGLQAELEAILQELTTAIQTIVGDLGLTAALAFLNPLLASLGGLLLSLVPVVNNLLALVQSLLDGLLIGLGLGLGALVL